jgi:hypothetical protein
VHERGIAADEVDTHLRGRAVQLAREARVVVRVAALRHERHGRHRHACVDDGHAVLALDLLPGGNQPLGAAADLVVGLAAGDREVRMRAVPQADAHRDGADVELLHLHHADGLDDLLGRELQRHARPYTRCM